MKKFLIKANVFFAILLLLFLLIFFTPSEYNSEHFLSSIRVKHKRLDSIKSPKLILVGGSNVLFGVNSKKIQERFNHQVVNMSLHREINFSFILNEIIDNVDSNDIIILMPEYNQYYFPSGSNSILYKVIASYPNGIRFVRAKNIPLVFVNTSILKLKHLIERYIFCEPKLKRNGVYSLKGVNKYGDQTKHLNRENKSELIGDHIDSLLDAELATDFTTILTCFLKKIENKNARVYFSFPSISKSAYCDEVGNNVYSYLQDINVDILGNPENFVFEDSLFYDTQYHLGRRGRNKRTEKLISLLKKRYQ